MWTLQSLSNDLFNSFHHHKIGIGLWNAIAKRYKNKDKDNKSFLVNRYVEFKLVDFKPIMDQIFALNNIIDEYQRVGENFLSLSSLYHHW